MKKLINFLFVILLFPICAFADTSFSPTQVVKQYAQLMDQEEYEKMNLLYSPDTKKRWAKVLLWVFEDPEACKVFQLQVNVPELKKEDPALVFDKLFPKFIEFGMEKIKENLKENGLDRLEILYQVEGENIKNSHHAYVVLKTSFLKDGQKIGGDNEVIDLVKSPNGHWLIGASPKLAILEERMKSNAPTK